jgi:Cof subfamily protein (haloacid dehalogenase superfamily)
MIPKLLAFDLDGTLLTTDKTLTAANREALLDMSRSGATVALASGRLGSSMMRYAMDLADIDIAMLTLNGAAVYAGRSDNGSPVYEAPLDARYADELVGFADGKDFAINYYIDDKLHTVHTDQSASWIDLYHQQTHTTYHYCDDLSCFAGRNPSKIIFVGDPRNLDALEQSFRARWDSELYIVRTWDYYLEFLNTRANKANGIRALAKALGVEMSDVVAFGDADNDVPMLQAAGLGIAMKNASDDVKKRSHYVSAWTNDQDGVAREWERIKKL